jgi:hypothetical protein
MQPTLLVLLDFRNQTREAVRSLIIPCGKVNFDLWLLDLWRCIFFLMSGCSGSIDHNYSDSLSMSCIAFSPLGRCEIKQQHQLIAFCLVRDTEFTGLELITRNGSLLTFLETFFSRTSYLSRVRSHNHVPGHTNCQG